MQETSPYSEVSYRSDDGVNWAPRRSGETGVTFDGFQRPPAPSPPAPLGDQSLGIGFAGPTEASSPVAAAASVVVFVLYLFLHLKRGCETVMGGAVC
jgi:hypothetical protein